MEEDFEEKGKFSKKLILVLCDFHPGIIYSAATTLERQFPDVVIDVFDENPIKTPIGIVSIETPCEVISILQSFLNNLANSGIIQKPDNI